MQEFCFFLATRGPSLLLEGLYPLLPKSSLRSSHCHPPTPSMILHGESMVHIWGIWDNTHPQRKHFFTKVLSQRGTCSQVGFADLGAYSCLQTCASHENDNVLSVSSANESIIRTSVLMVETKKILPRLHHKVGREKEGEREIRVSSLCASSGTHPRSSPYCQNLKNRVSSPSTWSSSITFPLRQCWLY